MFCGSGRSKGRLAKAAGAEEKCTPLWREARLEVNMYKTRHVRTTFGSWDVEKAHAVVARSTFKSENVKNATCSDHFWTSRCRPAVKKCTRLWREAHLDVKNHKTLKLRSTFGSWDVEKVHAVVARSTFPSQKCLKLGVLSHFRHSDVALLTDRWI